MTHLQTLRKVLEDWCKVVVGRRKRVPGTCKRFFPQNYPQGSVFARKKGGPEASLFCWLDQVTRRSYRVRGAAVVERGVVEVEVGREPAGPEAEGADGGGAATPELLL